LSPLCAQYRTWAVASGKKASIDGRVICDHQV
jgi:hypothetical protein